MTPSEAADLLVRISQAKVASFSEHEPASDPYADYSVRIEKLPSGRFLVEIDRRPNEVGSGALNIDEMDEGEVRRLLLRFGKDEVSSGIGDRSQLERQPGGVVIDSRK